MFDLFFGLKKIYYYNNNKVNPTTRATFCRSLIAAYLLVLNGYTNVFHLEGGLYAWFKEGLPAITEDEE